MRKLDVSLALVLAFAGLIAAKPASLARAEEPVCNAPLTLELRTGLHLPTVEFSRPVQWKAAADIPRGPVFMSLPLYLGATVSDKPFSHWGLTIFSDPYLKSGSAEFHVQADHDAVSSWYDQALGACGYEGAGTSGPGGDRNGPGSDGAWYRLLNDPRHVFSVIALQRDPAGGTIVLEVGEDLVYPPRPANTYLPKGIIGAHLRYLALGSTPADALNWTIRNSTAIHSLVAAVNSVTDVVPPHVLPCGYGVYDARVQAWVRFTSRSHKKILVIDNPGCSLIRVGRTRLLKDFSKTDGQVVWTAIRAVVRECEQKGC